jgi:branched-subunit amino acid transport protein
VGIIYLIGGAAAIVYLCRLSGFVLTRFASSAALARFLHYIPIAIFSALLVPSVTREPVLLGSKLAALAVAGVVMRQTRQFGLGIIVGLVLFWFLTWLGT